VAAESRVLASAMAVSSQRRLPEAGQRLAAARRTAPLAFLLTASW